MPFGALNCSLSYTQLKLITDRGQQDGNLLKKNYRKFIIASWLSNVGNTLFYLALMTYASKLPNYT